MEALLSSFGVVFLAEMGDKTQLLVMAFAAKYHWRPVLGGMFLGILAVHSLAVAAGNVVGSYLSPELMQGVAGAAFLLFGFWTLRAEDEDEEAHDSVHSPLWTVAAAFFVGEMGDKTQFAAMTMAAAYPSWQLVLMGAVLGMVLISWGLSVGPFFIRSFLPRSCRFCLAASSFSLVQQPCFS